MSLVTVHIHVDSPPELVEDIHDIKLALKRVEEKLRNIMATVQELEAELVSINEQTTAMGATMTEVASDVDDLLAKVQAGDVTAAVALAQTIKSNIAASASELSAIAAKHTPDAPPSA